MHVFFCRIECGKTLKRFHCQLRDSNVRKICTIGYICCCCCECVCLDVDLLFSRDDWWPFVVQTCVSSIFLPHTHSFPTSFVLRRTCLHFWSRRTLPLDMCQDVNRMHTIELIHYDATNSTALDTNTRPLSYKLKRSSFIFRKSIMWLIMFIQRMCTLLITHTPISFCVPFILFSLSSSLSPSLSHSYLANFDCIVNHVFYTKPLPTAKSF